MFVFVGLGSNLGDRAANLRVGVEGFVRIAGEQELLQSPVYESAPMYRVEQPAFLNMVVGRVIEADVLELLARFKILESEMGRDLSSDALRYGPRPLDIDILLAYEGDWLTSQDAVPIVLDSPVLTIPHPKMAERAFVLFPLRDLVPDLRHPVLHRTIAELAKDVAGQDARKVDDVPIR